MIPLLPPGDKTAQTAEIPQGEGPRPRGASGLSGESSVHGDRRAGHITSALAGQVGDGRGDVIGLP